MFNWVRGKLFRDSVLDVPKQEVAEVSGGGKPKYAGVAPKDRYDQIEFAFTSGGVNYFRFTSEVNIPFQRAIAAKEILTEELWQIDPKVLTGWVEGLIALLTDDKKKADKKLIEAGIMAYRLKEQMELSYSLVRQLKLATVLYFDEHENPLDYQYPYNKAKLESWTKHNDIPDFFLNLPDFLLQPSGQELAQNFPTYLAAESKRQINLLKHIIGNLPLDDSGNALRTDLLGQLETLNTISTWSNDPFTSTTQPTTIS
jgi:hypothetical protein